MPNGLLLIDKPEGVRSTDCVARVRRAFGRGTRVGHAGTLDSTASGLLVVLVGSATRLSDYVMRLPKVYSASVRLGAETDTCDRTGEVVFRGDAACADEAALDRIPEDLAEVMDNVVVLVQDEPDPEMLTEEDYDDSGMPTLLGLYDGVPLTERDEGWSMVLPDRILIFRGPLERWCTSREELEEEITVTVIHEVAHHFGIPDERLHELGWE